MRGRHNVPVLNFAHVHDQGGPLSHHLPNRKAAECFQHLRSIQLMLRKGMWARLNAGNTRLC